MAPYAEYIHCGEIFKPPSLANIKPYLLKCNQCEDIFMLLESFVSHIENSCEQKEQSIKEDLEYLGQIECRSVTSELECDDQCDSEFNAQTDSTNNDKADAVENLIQIRENESMGFDPLVLAKNETAHHDGYQLEIEIDDNADQEDHGEECTIVEALTEGEEDNVAENEEEKVADDRDENALCNVTVDDSNSNKSDGDSDYESSKKILPKKRSELEYMINNFMQCHANVNALIDAYRAQTSLWNKRTKEPLRQKNHRQHCLEKITQELNNKLKLDLHWRDISTLIMHICRKFREDLKQLKETQGKRKKFKTQWYFEQMQFLQPFVENNYIAKLDPHLPNLSPEQIVQICKIYESLPHLWNTNLIEYRCKIKRSDAELQMVTAIEATLNYKIDTTRLTKYLKYIHLYFSHEKRKRLNNDNVKTGSKYYKHMRFLYDHVGPFKCSECDYESQSSFKLRSHMSQHDGSMPFKCPQCDKEFATLHSYDIHVRRHMNDFRDVCKECGRKFINPKDLEIHMRTHTDAMPYCCEICGISFRHIQTLKGHKRRHEKLYLHSCELCSKGFYSKAKLRDHMKTHTNIRDCICKTCGKAFKTMNSLRTHETIHSDVRKYVCSICGKTFKLPNGLTQHMRTHGTKLGEDKNSSKSTERNKMKV